MTPAVLRYLVRRDGRRFRHRMEAHMTDMTTDTTAPVTLTRYGVIAADEALVQAVKWMPYETREDADRLRRYLDRKVPSGAPYRVVEIQMTITEEGAER